MFTYKIGEATCTYGEGHAAYGLYIRNENTGEEVYIDDFTYFDCDSEEEQQLVLEDLFNEFNEKLEEDRG